MTEAPTGNEIGGGGAGGAGKGALLRALRGILDSFPEPVMLCEPDGRVAYANRRLVETFGMGPDTVQPDSLNVRTHPLTAELDVAQTVDRALAGEVVTMPEIPVAPRHYFGTDPARRAATQYVDATASPVHDDSGGLAYVLVALRNVTERRQTRAALAQREAELLRAQKMEAIGRLASGVAHDFNNLLTVVLGHGALAFDGLPEESPIREDIKEILRAGERGAVVTRQLLVLGRRQVLRPEPLDPNAVVSDVAKLLDRLIGEDVELAVDLSEGLGQLVADRGQLEQVLMNLAVNARDAMPEGGKLSIRTSRAVVEEGSETTPAGLAPGTYVRLTVEDSGSGMTDEVLAHAFEPFFTTKAEGKGSGLGLPTVYGIVAQSGGGIAVDTRLGLGTTFDVYLPVEGVVRGRLVSGVRAAFAPGGCETLLLVEDDGAVRGLLRRALEAQGYRVLAASDGVEALRILEEEAAPIELVITDIVMPRMKGPELVARLARRDPALLVLYISGYPDEWSLLQECLTREESLLQKPFTTETLLQRVREILDSRRRRAEV